jgi:hypothetical protein
LFAKSDDKIQNLMKILAFLFTLIIGFSINAQQFSIPAEEFPFFDIIEWKGQGAILLNRDPSGLKRKVNLTTITEQPTSKWQESFNPTGKEYFYISSENARYIYFLEQLQPIAGKISFSQVNIAGNVKNSTADLSSPIKRLGSYDINEFKMIDAFTTDKALVFMMRYQDKEENKFVDFMITMTHHNLLVYATIIGEVSEINLKDPRYGHWTYSGFQGDNIIFSIRDVQDKKSGFTICTFNQKGELTETRFVEGPGVSFEAISTGSFGTSGRFYLGTAEMSAGSILTINGKYHFIGNRLEGTKRSLELYSLIEGEWLKIKSIVVPIDSSKKSPSLSVMALNEGVACIVGGSSVFLPFDAEANSVINTATKFTPFNPSSVMVSDLKNRFAVSLPNGILLFETKQLSVPGSVNFEFVKK